MSKVERQRSREEWPPLSERPKVGKISLVLSISGGCCWGLTWLGVEFPNSVFSDGYLFVIAALLGCVLFLMSILTGLLGMPDRKAAFGLGISLLLSFLVVCWLFYLGSLGPVFG